jgi:hypothetical protein
MNYGVTSALDGAQIADPVIIANNPTNRSSVQFLVSTTVPPAPTIQPIPVTFKWHQTRDARLALQWLRSNGLDRQLVDSKTDVVFPHLKPFWERIGAMGIDNATMFLQERIESTTRGSLTFFGVSVDRDLVLWVGPGLCAFLLLFFWLHLRITAGKQKLMRPPTHILGSSASQTNSAEPWAPNLNRLSANR